ncbi:C-type mannose receptor 2-like [Lycodopsis pacificus]
MRWSLFVLILMGQCSFCLCRLYEYHYVEESKSWDEAQKYCRDNYTDLATVFDMTDMNRLLRKSASNPGKAWIGLRNQNNVNRTWLWSLPGVEFNDSETEWNVNGDNNEPNDGEHPENCVFMNNHKWFDLPCHQKRPFICYDETNQNKFHLIYKWKTWREAQSYCREHHTDLVSGPTQLNDEEFKTEIEPERNSHVWIGLFRDTWRWSDESSSSFRSWDPDLFQDEDNKRCAMTLSNGKWSSDECSNTKPFFCYDDEVILINKNKTWEQALTYCRKYHHELVSITNLQEQRWVEDVAKKANSTHVWTGLRYTCTLGFWFWITDEAVKYDNWESHGDMEEGDMDECHMSGAMKTSGDHKYKWSKKDASMKFNFICT